MELIRHIFKTFQPSELLIGIGSSQESYTPRQPFTAGERFDMITRTLLFEKVSRCWVIPIPDINVHAVWVSHVESLLPRFEQVYSNDPLTRVLFEEAGYEVPELPFFNRGSLEGSEIRRRMLAGEDWKGLVPVPVLKVLEELHGEERVRALGRSPEATRLQGSKDV
jgi:nicotinamide-nucleotide adenylyltransferase